ncbi:MAG: ABC transporter ATP-binding protein [Candidatus Bipolaricaulia bacterium]
MVEAEYALALDIRDLYVSFQGYEGISRVLDGISLQVAKGEWIGLAGETGCGKTVTMKTVMGMLKTPPATIQGKVHLNGRDVLKMSEKELLQTKGTEISMIFQDPMNALNPVFTVGEQLHDVIQFAQKRLSHKHQGKLSKKEIHDRTVAALKEVRLPDPQRIMTSYPLELSGGMRQRVLIAMALVNEPRLLIADEPGTALDVTIQAQILNLLNELVKTRMISVLLISHNLGVIGEMTERVYIMYAGQVMETAPTGALFENPKHPYTQGLLASVPRLTGEAVAEGVQGMVPDYTAAPSGCRFNPRCDHVMPICSQKKPPLIEIEPDHYVACYLYTEPGDQHENG